MTLSYLKPEWHDTEWFSNIKSGIFDNANLYIDNHPNVAPQNDTQKNNFQQNVFMQNDPIQNDFQKK
jgi:hypothetical protein